MTVTLQYNTRR